MTRSGIVQVPVMFANKPRMVLDATVTKTGSIENSHVVADFHSFLYHLIKNNFKLENIKNSDAGMKKYL